MLSPQIPGQTHAHAEFEFVDDTGCTLSKIFQDDLDYLRSLEPVMIIWLGRVNIITANGMISLREILLRVNIPVEGVRHRVNERNTTGYLGQWTGPGKRPPRPPCTFKFNMDAKILLHSVGARTGWRLYDCNN
jgi:hypothetical protein